jgi:tetratricopeptide (TPR) repeat protein
LIGKGENALAETFLHRALEITPKSGEVHYLLGLVHQANEQYVEAIKKFNDALELQPNRAEILFAIGTANWHLGNKDVMQTMLKKVHDLKAGDFADYGMAWLYLPEGDFKRGWPAYDVRLNTPSPKSLQSTTPRWDGGALNGKKLLIFAEQGYGDTLQFIRFIPQIKDANIMFVCQGGLETLVASCVGAEHVMPRAEYEAQPVAHDKHIQLMSLPLMLGVDDVAKIPAKVPYVFADAEKTAAWKKHLGDMSSQIRVGLVWGGNPSHKNDKARSIGLRHFLPLAGFAGVDFFSLQKGEAVFEGNEYGAQLSLHDLDGDLTDWDETAAAIMNLDLVIAVDTAIAHLAGALGKPVWLLIPKFSDWRWLNGMETSPWYPTMRVFRQTKSGDWPEVMQRVQHALGEFAASNIKSAA